MTFFTNYAEDCAQVTLSGGLNLISGVAPKLQYNNTAIDLIIAD